MIDWVRGDNCQDDGNQCDDGYFEIHESEKISC